MKNHHHSTANPKAMYQIETPLQEVMGAEMISYPNTKLMCSVNVDGFGRRDPRFRRAPPSASGSWDGR